MKSGTEVEVIWLDAASDNDWIDQKDACKDPKSKFKKVAYYLGEDKYFTYFASDLGIEGNPDCNRFAIPVGGILSIKKL